MPSPFPGMDPFLEGELWQEFHETLAGAIRAQLMPRLAPKYVALLARRYVLQNLDLSIMGSVSPRVLYPDVHLVKPHEPDTLGEGGSTSGVAEPAMELASPVFEQVPSVSVEIRNIAERRLVTVIEILSPVPLELQAAVRGCFDLVGYERLLGYSSAPPPPPLSQSEAAWVRQCLELVGMRRERSG